LDEAILALHPLIVNTTPLGMAPHTDTAPPMPYEWLSPAHLLYDLVYNPEKTLFLSEGEALGCPVKNGLEMLHLQAERAWEIWNRLPHNNV
jgi:shikimate dehydrogenase